MNETSPLLPSQKVVRVCLILVGLIALAGGALQFWLGQPDTTPRLDNVHRFMAGIYFGSGLIALWAAANIRWVGSLVFLLALTLLFAGTGRLVSMSQVGLPEPSALWLGYLVPELILPIVMSLAHLRTLRHQSRKR